MNKISFFSPTGGKICFECCESKMKILDFTSLGRAAVGPPLFFLNPSLNYQKHLFFELLIYVDMLVFWEYLITLFYRVS
jgi:hypothetical protein